MRNIACLKKYDFLVFFVLVSFVWVVVASQFDFDGQSKEPASYAIEKRIQYSFVVKNTTNDVLTDPYFSVYSPVDITSHQKLLSLETSHQSVAKKDKYQNQVLTFNFDKLAPYESKVVRIRAVLAMSEQPNRLLEESNSDFLGNERLMEVDHPKIESMAEKFSSANDSLRSLYEFVSGHINYSGYVKDDKGALYALESGAGDCTEYAYLFASIARAMGFESRVIGGYVYAGNATLDSQDYHNWVEVKVDGKWRIVDPLKKRFMDNAPSFIAMRIITPSNASLLGSSHQILYSHDALIVDMQ